MLNNRSFGSHIWSSKGLACCWAILVLSIVLGLRIAFGSGDSACNFISETIKSDWNGLPKIFSFESVIFVGRGLERNLRTVYNFNENCN